MHSTTQLIIIAVAVTLGICLAYHILRRRQATSAANLRGYSSGYSAAITARQPVIDELTKLNNSQALEISTVNGLRQGEKAKHRETLDAITQDADNRVKLFAQRCLSDHELLWVKRAITQLDESVKTHGFLGNGQAVRDALAVKEHLTKLAARLQPSEQEAAA